MSGSEPSRWLLLLADPPFLTVRVLATHLLRGLDGPADLLGPADQRLAATPREVARHGDTTSGRIVTDSIGWEVR